MGTNQVIYIPSLLLSCCNKSSFIQSIHLKCHSRENKMSRTLWYDFCRIRWKSFKRLKFLGLTSTSVPSKEGAHSCLKNSFQPRYLAHILAGWSSPSKNTLFKKPAYNLNMAQPQSWRRTIYPPITQLSISKCLTELDRKLNAQANNHLTVKKQKANSGISRINPF